MRASILATALCLIFSWGLAIPLEKPEATPTPSRTIGWTRPTKLAHSTARPSRTRLGATHLHKDPTPSIKIPVVVPSARHTKGSVPDGGHTVEAMVKKVAQQVSKEQKSHPDIQGQPEEKPLLELFGAVYMRKAMKKEGGAIRDTKIIEWHQAQLKKKMATMSHAQLRDLVQKYHKLLSAETTPKILVKEQKVAERDHHDEEKLIESKAHSDEEHHREKRAEPEFCAEEVEKRDVPAEQQQQHQHKDELDFNIGITLTRAALIPTRTPHRSHSTDCHHRPNHQSTLLPIPTTLSVPLDIDDEGHVSVIGQKSTGKEHDHGHPGHPASASGAKPTTKHQNHHKSHKTKHHRPNSTPGHEHEKHHRPTSTRGHEHNKHHRPTSTRGHEHNKHHRSTSTRGHEHNKHHRPTSTPGYKQDQQHLKTGHNYGATTSIRVPGSLPHMNSPSCTPVPRKGDLPRPVQNDARAFVSFPEYEKIGNASAMAPGFKAVFVNRHSRVDAPRHLLRDIPLTRYDVQECGVNCSRDPACKGFNVFIQRDPAMKLSSYCPHPPHQASAHCSLYNVPISRLPLGKVGQFLRAQRFERVYAASNGFDQLSSYPEWVGPGRINGIYRATTDGLFGQGHNQFIQSATFPGEIDPATCINACNRINANDRGAALQNHKFNVKNDTENGVKGHYRPCNFFNIFQLSDTGAASYSCTFWTSAPNAPKPIIVQTFGAQRVISSLWYNRRFDDIGRYHAKDLIENGPHDGKGSQKRNNPKVNVDNQHLKDLKNSSLSKTSDLLKSTNISKNPDVSKNSDVSKSFDSSKISKNLKNSEISNISKNIETIKYFKNLIQNQPLEMNQGSEQSPEKVGNGAPPQA